MLPRERLNTGVFHRFFDSVTSPINVVGGMAAYRALETR